MRTWHIHKLCSHLVPKAWCQMVGNAGCTFKTKKDFNFRKKNTDYKLWHLFLNRLDNVYSVKLLCVTVKFHNSLTIFYRYPGGLHSAQSSFVAFWARFSAHRHSSLVDMVAAHQQQLGSSSQHGRTHDQHSKRDLETANSIVKTTIANRYIL